MYRYVKRGIDIICALLGIAGTLPLWLFAMAGIYVSDPGNVFYLATRIGKNNKPFRMFKFRSMRNDRNADERSVRPDQSRIFPFGRLIRALRIDELPQLLNVLGGSMSVIGPRPVANDQKKLFRTGRWNRAAEVSVGISGPAAIYDLIYGDSVPDENDYMRKVFPTRRELEYLYVEKMGFLYDARMVWETIVCIFYRATGRRPEKILERLEADAKASIQAHPDEVQPSSGSIDIVMSNKKTSPVLQRS